MYKSFSSELLWFPGRSIKDDIPLAAKYGYGGINFDIKKESAAITPGEFSELLSKNNLKPGSFALPVEFRNDRKTFENDIGALRPCCEFALKTGTTRCTTYIMSYSDTLDYSSNFKQHRERLAVAAEILGEYGICLGLEFLGPLSIRRGKAYGFIHNLDGLNELLEAIGMSNTGYLLDVFHWEMAGQVFDDFKKIASNDRIITAHLSDAPAGISRDEQPNHQRELPGATGILHIKEFIKGLHDLNYDGPVLIEPFNMVLKKMPFEEAVKEAKTAMDKVWF